MPLTKKTSTAYHESKKSVRQGVSFEPKYIVILSSFNIENEIVNSYVDIEWLKSKKDKRKARYFSVVPVKSGNRRVFRHFRYHCYVHYTMTTGDWGFFSHSCFGFCCWYCVLLGCVLFRRVQFSLFIASFYGLAPRLKLLLCAWWLLLDFFAITAISFSLMF